LLIICVVAQGFNLSEENVMALHGVFKEVLAGRKTDKVRITEVFKKMVRTSTAAARCALRTELFM